MRQGSRARFERWLSDDAGALRRGRFALVLAVIYLVFWATYVPINLFSVGRPSYRPFLPGEERLPFLPVFEYLYVLILFVPVLLLVTVRSYARFVRLVRALAIALVVSYASFLLVPVYLERPSFEVTSLHTWLLSLQYLDKSYNHLPSLHVTLSWLAVHSAQCDRRTRLVLILLACGISISTLFVKQHYIVDVVLGYALAWGAWRLGAAGWTGASARARPASGARKQ